MSKKLLLLVLSLMGVGLSFAQSLQVSGKVVADSSNQGLAGVSIFVSETKKGTSTDENGNFRISVSGRKTVTLLITSVGYRSQTLTSNGQTPLTIRLRKEDVQLEDVVVIGYQSVKRKDLTGTVSSISGTQLEKIPVANVAEALTGRLPGVQVTTVDGQPGAEVVIRVRGGGSLTGSNDPLYIVDGFRVSSLNDIAPSDIASIDILKDAATAAIYGAAGANGVVIITTKSAKGGKTAINLNSFGQAKTLPRKLEVLSPYEYVLAQYEYARIRSQAEVDNISKFFGVYQDFDLYKYQAGTDWQDKLFGNPAYSQQHGIGVTGGSDKTKMAVNFTNNKDLGLIPSNSYQRNYFNFKLSHEVSKALKLDINARYTHAITNGAGTAGAANLRVGDGITTRPVNGIADMIILDGGTNADDYEQFIRNLINPLKLAEQDYRKRVTRALNLNGGVSWAIRKNLNYRSEFSYGINNGNNRRYYGPLTGVSRNEGGNLPLGEITQTEQTDYRWANTLAYTLRKTKHDLNVLVGQEILSRGLGFEEYNRAKYFSLGITPQKLFATMGLGTPDIHTTSEIASDKTASFFARAIYQLSGKYIFNLTARYDGTTKFAPGKQWGLFPAASFAWRMSSEKFMDNVKFVSDLKFRASYGTVGNNNIRSDQWRVLFGPSSTRPYGAGDIPNPYYTYASSQLPNPDIKWETTITRNIGLDFAFFRNRLLGTLDLYHNTTKDLLVESAIPQTTGFSSQQRNIGQTSNRGIELGLTGDIFREKNFQLSLSFNVGVNRSKIDKLDGVNERSFNSNWAGTDLKTQDDYRLIVGQTIGLMYGYVTDGMYSVDDFESYDAVSKTYKLKAGVPTVNLGGISLRPGILKFKDLDGDGKITAENDRTIIGRALPKATGGFGLTSTFKNFDFNAFFNWVVGNDVYNTGKISFNMNYRSTYGNMLNTVNYDSRFHYIDAGGNLVTDLQELAKLNPDPKIWSPFSMGPQAPWFHSWAVEDGSFLRLNNISVGYSLPKKWISKLYMTKVRVYTTVYNAFLITNYSGYDPEVSTTRNSGYSQLTPGVDYSAFPKSRNFTIGANVTF
jgi:TonB-dependent starch-binding outer membrane protein SusC